MEAVLPSNEFTVFGTRFAKSSGKKQLKFAKIQLQKFSPHLKNIYMLHKNLYRDDIHYIFYSEYQNYNFVSLTHYIFPLISVCYVYGVVINVPIHFYRCKNDNIQI